MCVCVCAVSSLTLLFFGGLLLLLLRIKTPRKPGKRQGKREKTPGQRLDSDWRALEQRSLICFAIAAQLEIFRVTK